MKTYRFSVQLGECSIGLDAVDRLYAIASDAASSTSAGEEFVEFDRESDSLEAAILSAVRDLRQAGMEPMHVNIDADSISVLEATS